VHGLLFGMETELAFSAWSTQSPPAQLERPPLLSELFAQARRRLVSLPDVSGPGMFLENGSRLYLDCGDHPELCTPECHSPAEVVCWQLAGERILAELVGEIEKRDPDSRLALFRCNVDYAGSGHTWGCHENYQHRQPLGEMSAQLMSHLVTRIVYSGAGGVNNRKGRFEFLLSPRVPHLLHDVASAGSARRGILQEKNEPLSKGGFSRLHLICGESLSSQLANYLKMGTTALVVRLVDAGVCSGDGLALRAPLRAMQAFARDPRCRARAELHDGRRLTALEIQTEYLAMVETNLGAEFMPDWAGEVCLRWRRVLEQLASAPEALATSLDWAIKYALFRDRAKRRRVPWSRLTQGLAAELREIDTRFGELGERGLFHRLDGAGALAHRIPELGLVEEAMVRPPPGGRAEARGKAIRELHAETGRYRCDWDAIQDLTGNRVLDMSNPFNTSPGWKGPLPRQRKRQPDVRLLEIDRLLDRGVDCYQRMECGGAVHVLGGAIREARGARDREREAKARFWCATAHQDLGNLDGAASVIAPALGYAGRAVSTETAARVWTRYAMTLLERPAPVAEIRHAIERARAVSRVGNCTFGHSRLSTLEGRLLGARGEVHAAVAVTERALDEGPGDPIAFGRASCLHWLVVFLLRAGQLRRARLEVAGWRESSGAGGLLSYEEVVLTCAESVLARLHGKHDTALERAGAALGRSTPGHRSRLTACCTFVEAAAAAGEFEQAGPVLQEMRRWREIGIGELRYDMQRAQAAFHLARQAPD
jgi:proteasome accessory factor A